MSAPKISGARAPGGSKLQKRAVEVEKTVYDYQIFAPEESEQSFDLPIIVFLHGIRERGTGGYVPTEGVPGALVRQYFGRVPALVVLPQCRPGKYWSDAPMDEMVVRALDQTKNEFGADASRLYLAGVSMGGYGVWHFAMNYPEKFAAYVSICGGSPLTSGDRFIPIARKVGKTPAWLFHGADDPIVPVGESRSLVKAFNEAGANIKYSEYTGVGHNVWLNALSERNLMPWLFAQRSSGK